MNITYTTDSPVDKTETFSHDCSSVVDTNDHQWKSNNDIQNSDNFAQLSFGRLVPIPNGSNANNGVKKTVGKSPLDLGFILMSIPTFDLDGLDDICFKFFESFLDTLAPFFFNQDVGFSDVGPDFF